MEDGSSSSSVSSHSRAGSMRWGGGGREENLASRVSPGPAVPESPPVVSASKLLSPGSASAAVTQAAVHLVPGSEGAARLIPVPPLKIPGITADTMQGRRGRAARTTRSSKAKAARTHKIGAKTARPTMRAPFWQVVGAVALPESSTIPQSADDHDQRVAELEAKITKMLSVNDDEDAAAAVAGEDAEDIEVLEEERKRVLDKALVKNAAREGFRIMNLYRARKKDGSGTAWAPLHPSFRFVVNAEEQLLIRVERDADYVPGTRRPDNSPEAQRAHLHCSEMITATWSVKDLHRVERIKGPFEDEELPGCAFSVWVQVGEVMRALPLWAPGTDGVALMQDFSRALLIASSRLMYLGIRLGSKGFPGQENGAEQTEVNVSEVLRLGITPRHTVVEMAEKPKELRGLVTSGALSLRGRDAASVWSRGYNTCDDELRLVISRTWKNVEERRKVAEKLRLAGVLTCHDLVELMECHAPREAEYLPRWSWFRGQPCLLNYRIDVNGGKLLKTSTMEVMHKLSLLPIDAEVGYGPAHGHMPIAMESQDLWKLVQSLWPNVDKNALDAIFMKIQRAGARTVPDLCDLISEEGPPGCLLPASTFFRGRSCMLNFNIDELGGKLFLSSTLETLYSRAVYQKMFDPSTGSNLLRTSTSGSKRIEDRKKDKALLQEQAAEERRRIHLQNVLEVADHSDSQAQIVFEVHTPHKSFQINDDVLHVAFSHDGKLMALARANGVVSLISTSSDLDQWKPLHSADMHHHHGAINYCCFRPVDAEAYLPDHILAVASADGAMSIWNLTSLRKPECIRILEHGGSSVTTCTFSACGRLLASGDTEGCCRLFEVCGWNPLNSKGVAMPSASRPTHDWFATHELLGHRGTERSITCLSFAVDSSMLASASLDTTVRLWQQQSEGQHSGKWRSSYCIHLPGPVNYIQFAPVGLQVLANCLNDDRAYIWDIGTILNQHDAWHYEVLDCGDNKDEIICSSAAWTHERWWTAIGLAVGKMTLWCAKPQNKSTQVANVSNGSDWVSKCVSFSQDSKFMVCISQLKQEALEKRRNSSDKTDGEIGVADLPQSEVLVYNLELLAAQHEQELDSIIGTQERRPASPPSRQEIKVQDRVLAHVYQSSHVWLEEVVAHLEATMGRDALMQFFGPRSSAQSIHEIALERAQRTIAFLTNSNRAIAFGQPGEREADVIFRREEAIVAQAENQPKNSLQDLQWKQTQEQLLLQERRVCMVLEWILSTSKLFQVVWNSYVFNSSPSLDESVEISSQGRVATKARGADVSASLIWLNPALPVNANAEAEFLIEKWTAALPEDSLRVGILQRGVSTRNEHQQRGKAHDVTWMYGCGTGMRFHTQGPTRRADAYTKFIAQELDKFSVCIDRDRCTMSIKINGESQGVMYEDIPAHGDLHFAVQLVSKNESVRTPEAFIRSSWCSEPRHVEIDALQFKVV